MVQFKPVLKGQKREPDDHHYRSNTYWMLGFYLNMTAQQAITFLKKHDYRCRANHSKAAAMDAIGRYQRGLLPYEKYDVEELRTFCKPRGILSKATTSPRLARVLEKADDGVIFSRFLELPSEIRNTIYELHYRDYEKISTKHFQPQLTLASKQFRTEALPLFYSCVTFVWNIDTKHDDDHKYQTAFRRDSEGLLRMPAANLARIKLMNLNWAIAESLVTKAGLRVNRHIYLYAHLNKLKSRQATAAIFMKRKLPCKLLRDTLNSALAETGYYGGDQWKLGVEHLAALEEALHGSVNGYWVYKF